MSRADPGPRAARRRKRRRPLAPTLIVRVSPDGPRFAARMVEPDTGLKGEGATPGEAIDALWAQVEIKVILDTPAGGRTTNHGTEDA